MGTSAAKLVQIGVRITELQRYENRVFFYLSVYSQCGVPGCTYHVSRCDQLSKAIIVYLNILGKKMCGTVHKKFSHTLIALVCTETKFKLI